MIYRLYTSDKSIAGVAVNGDQLLPVSLLPARISPRIFVKIRKWPQWDTQGPVETDL
jgi:hypothetical protein